MCAMAVSEYVERNNNIVATPKREFVDNPQDRTGTGCPMRKVPTHVLSETSTLQICSSSVNRMCFLQSTDFHSFSGT